MLTLIALCTVAALLPRALAVLRLLVYVTYEGRSLNIDR